MHIAAICNSVGCMKLLLKKDGDINCKDSKGRTPLILAALNGHTRAIDLLLQAKAEIACQDNFLNTALHYACRKRHPSAAFMLLKRMKDNTVVNISNKKKKT